MRDLSKILIAATVALVCFALPGTAQADRVYYLVGVRHIYRIGTDKYAHAAERKQIEEDYADEVSADNAHYQYQISHGADPNVESNQLQSALHDLAAERERRLSALYPTADWARNRYSGFDIRVDGPYQVIGVDYRGPENDPVIVDYVPYAPWPGYTYVGPYPYGWNYGAVYTPTLFVGAYHGWYGGWVGFGSPAFVGFYGYGGPVVVAGLSVNVGLGFGIGMGFGGFFYNPGLGGYYHRGPGYFAHDVFRGGYIAGRGDPRAVAAGRAGFAAGAASIRSARAAGFASGIRAGAHSSFAGSATRSAAGAGYAHSSASPAARRGTGSFAPRATSARAGSGYAHSAVGGTAHGGSFAHSGGTRTNTMHGGNPAHTSPAAHSSPRPSFGRAPTRSSFGTSSHATSRPSGSFGGGRSTGGGTRSSGKHHGG